MSKLQVVVLGGGTAGWMSAAGLARMLGEQVSVTLVESEDIGIVGVGEATLPHIRHFVERLGIDEAAFMKATHATYKLGIEFRDFGAIGESYVHPFGDFGQEVAGVPFHHYWLEMQRQGRAAPIGAYSLGVAASLAHKFRPPAAGDALGSTYGYAYQFDSARFGPFMREFGVAHGVTRIEGRVVSVERAQNGDVAGLVLEDGQRIAGDLFVDCSGFRSLLLGDALAEPWEDWSHWLPCDSAVAVPCAHASQSIAPFTTATAMAAGWRWRIPLQHRVGNGYVYASRFTDDATAREKLIASLEGKMLAEPRQLRFKAGRRRHSWVGNVVAVGLASGFLEPLESTSIYLAQMAITNLIELFPTGGGIDARDRAAFNRAVDMEYDRIRDFLILHYNATRRDDSPFWNHVRTMELPDTLQSKMELWQQAARVERYHAGLFYEASWVAVMLGQGVMPQGHDPRAALAPVADLAGALNELERAVAAEVADMPDHRRFLEERAERLAVMA
jgi:tryptophan halogenase